MSLVIMFKPSFFAPSGSETLHVDGIISVVRKGMALRNGVDWKAAFYASAKEKG